MKTAIALWLAGGMLVVTTSRQLLRSSPMLVAVPTIAVGLLMLARGAWLLMWFRRRG